MADRTEYFSRIAGRVDVGELTQAFVVVVGVGSVGSLLALELARCGVGHMVLIDGDRLEVVNLPRHALPDHYVGTNKAEAMAMHLALNVPALDVGGAPHHLDESFEDEEIDRLLAPADLVVIATDQRTAQRRIARRALAMDIPAVVPGLYADRGGEVFVQLNPGEACFMCWDGFRDPGSEVRSVSSLNADAFAVIQQSLYLCVALLEPNSRHARDMAPSLEDPRPRQLFVLRPGAAMLRAPTTRRPDCLGCAVGPSPLNGEEHGAPDAAGVGGWVAAGHERPRAAGWRFILTGVRVPPEIVSVELSKLAVPEGEVVTLSWATRNATHVVIDGHGIHPPEGELAVAVRRSSAYWVRAVNPFDSTARLSRTVWAMPIRRAEEVYVPGFPGVTAPQAPAAPSIPLARLGARASAGVPRIDLRMPGFPDLPHLFAPLVPTPPTATPHRPHRPRHGGSGR